MKYYATLVNDIKQTRTNDESDDWDLITETHKAGERVFQTKKELNFWKDIMESNGGIVLSLSK